MLLLLVIVFLLLGLLPAKTKKAGNRWAGQNAGTDQIKGGG
jgi:hypothetical protein